MWPYSESCAMAFVLIEISSQCEKEEEEEGQENG